jgi:hypothetical protein
VVVFVLNVHHRRPWSLCAFEYFDHTGKAHRSVSSARASQIQPKPHKVALGASPEPNKTSDAGFLVADNTKDTPSDLRTTQAAWPSDLQSKRTMQPILYKPLVVPTPSPVPEHDHLPEPPDIPLGDHNQWLVQREVSVAPPPPRHFQAQHLHRFRRTVPGRFTIEDDKFTFEDQSSHVFTGCVKELAATCTILTSKCSIRFSANGQQQVVSLIVSDIGELARYIHVINTDRTEQKENSHD